MNEAKYSRFFCAQPFTNAAIDANGEVSLCCAAFLNKRAGNVLEASFPEVWNSESAQELRRSILDGDYAYCIEARCPFLQGEILLQTKEEVKDTFLRSVIDEHQTELTVGPRELHAAYDATCNLACPYCRSDYIVLKGEEFSKSERIHQRVVEGALPITDTLIVSSQGDPFASKLYSRILREFDAAQFPQLRMRMTTNGILFTPENWASIQASHGALEHIHVSVNGASKESFEANQRGASWEKLLENLAFISEHCRDNAGKKRFVTLSFIVQQNNYREMPSFVEMVRHFGFDRAHFGMIFQADRTYSDAEFAKLAVHWPNHPEHEEFLRVMADPLLRAPEALVVGGLAEHLPTLRHYFGHHLGATVSGAAFVHPEGVDWRGWASAQGLPGLEGVAEPKFIAFAGSEGPRIVIEEAALALGLAGAERDALAANLLELRAAAVTLFQLPGADGAETPLAATAAAVRAGVCDGLAAAVSTLFALAETTRPADGRMTYVERFSRSELEYRMRIYRTLDARQRKAYARLPIMSLFDIDVGSDPLIEALRALVLNDCLADTSPRERMPLAEFLRALGVQAPCDKAIHEILLGFKVAVATLFGEEPERGGPSPLALIAESLGGTMNAAAFDSLVRGSGPVGDGGTYSARIAALEAEARAGIKEALPGPVRYRLDWLPISSLMSVELPGIDPMAQALRAYVAVRRPVAKAG